MDTGNGERTGVAVVAGVVGDRIEVSGEAGKHYEREQDERGRDSQWIILILAGGDSARLQRYCGRCSYQIIFGQTSSFTGTIKLKRATEHLHLRHQLMLNLRHS